MNLCTPRHTPVAASADPPSMGDLAQAIVELRSAAIGHRAYAERCAELGGTAREREEELALAESCDRVIDWLRIQYQ